MTTKEELNIIKEEELAKVAGGVITTEGDPTEPGNSPSVNPDDPTSRPELCDHFFVDRGEVYRCAAHVADRTKPVCKICPAMSLFRLN